MEKNIISKLLELRLFASPTLVFHFSELFYDISHQSQKTHLLGFNCKNWYWDNRQFQTKWVEWQKKIIFINFLQKHAKTILCSKKVFISPCKNNWIIKVQKFRPKLGHFWLIFDWFFEFQKTALPKSIKNQKINRHPKKFWKNIQ